MKYCIYTIKAVDCFAWIWYTYFKNIEIDRIDYGYAKRRHVEKSSKAQIRRTEYYAATLHALNNMDKDLLLVAQDDKLGRTIQDLNLPTRRRASKKKNS